MPTLSAVRTALQARLATIPGLRAYALIPARPHPPYAAVVPRGLDFDQSFDGDATLELAVEVGVDGRDRTLAQAQLDTWLSRVSAVLEADQTLGGAVQACVLTGGGGYETRTLVPGEQIHLTARLDLQVM